MLLPAAPPPALDPRPGVWANLRHRPRPGRELKPAADRLVGRHRLHDLAAPTGARAEGPVEDPDALTVSAPGGCPAWCPDPPRWSPAPELFPAQPGAVLRGHASKRVGAGAWTADDVEAALLAKERAKCGPVRAAPRPLLDGRSPISEPLFPPAPQLQGSATERQADAPKGKEITPCSAPAPPAFGWEIDVIQDAGGPAQSCRRECERWE